MTEKIEKEQPSFMQLAMHYGAILGVFWLFKYLFIIGDGFTNHVFIFLFHLLNVGTFMLVYYIYLKYKSTIIGQGKKLIHGALFIALTCFFASFFEGLIMFIHYKFIHPEFFQNMISPYIEMVNKFPTPEGVDTAQFDTIKKTYVGIFSNSALYIVSNFMGNTILGFILALLIGAISPRVNNN